MKTLLSLLWLFLLASTAQASGTAIRMIEAQTLAIPTVGFSPPPYSISASDLEGEWQSVALPHAPTPQLPTKVADSAESNIPTFIRWYRMQVGEHPLADIDQPNYIYIPRWKTDGTIAVYADSRIVYQSHGNLLWNGSNAPLWIALDTTADATPPKEIFVRIQHLQGTGGALSSVWFGPQDELGWRYRTREWLQNQLPAMSSAAFLAVGIFALFIWIQRRERMYLFVFAMAVVSYLRTLHNYVGLQRLPISDEWFGWLTVNSMVWLVLVGHMFMTHLNGQQQRRMTWMLIGLAIVNGLLTFPLSPVTADATLMGPVTYPALLLIGGIAFTNNMRIAWRARSHEGVLLSVWILLCFAFGVYDWTLLTNLSSIEGAFLTPYSNCGIFFIFTYIMYRRYLGAIGDVEQANATLADRLRERETELATSYERLREVEHRQTLSNERQRLMQDMHDGLGSSLLSALRVVEGGRIGEDEVAEVLKGCIDDLKLAIDSMEPVEADLLLLLATLRYRLQSRLESSGIQLRWEVSDVPPLSWLDPRNSLHILRILQEAFTNIIKHTRATEIRVGTSVAFDSLLVTITDNGPGFDFNSALQAGGKGLANQLRRAQAIGAEIHWTSSAAGTSLTLQLPLERKSATAADAPRPQPA